MRVSRGEFEAFESLKEEKTPEKEGRGRAEPRVLLGMAGTFSQVQPVGRVRRQAVGGRPSESTSNAEEETVVSDPLPWLRGIENCFPSPGSDLIDIDLFLTIAYL